VVNGPPCCARRQPAPIVKKLAGNPALALAGCGSCRDAFAMLGYSSPPAKGPTRSRRKLRRTGTQWREVVRQGGDGK